MINLLPYQRETLVSSYSGVEVKRYLSESTAEINYLDRRSQSKKKGILFNGLIGKKGFRISKVIDKGDTFLPLILGKIEETPRGCIIFLQYRLFPGAVFFLAFWTLLLLFFSAYFIFGAKNYLNGSICFSLTLVNYLVSMFFFHRQVQSSRKTFFTLINFQMKD